MTGNNHFGIRSDEYWQRRAMVSAIDGLENLSINVSMYASTSTPGRGNSVCRASLFM